MNRNRNLHRRNFSALNAALAHLRMLGLNPTVEQGRGTHMKVRWHDANGDRMLVIGKDTGSWDQHRWVLKALDRKLRGEDR